MRILIWFLCGLLENICFSKTKTFVSRNICDGRVRTVEPDNSLFPYSVTKYRHKCGKILDLGNNYMLMYQQT